ncbi:MAG: nitroreductase family protein [Clostridia bacterium]|nr:nitroreductase family protein [Clostridia bacterium]
MDFTTVVKERYSCKKYSDKKVESEKLNEILEAGRLAPTAKNLQEQHIYVAQSEKALAIIDEVTPCRYNASTVLVVAYDKTNVYTYPNSEKQSGAEDATIVATHMLLAAKNAGVESCWVNCFDPEALKEKLNLPENEEIVMLLDLGYPTESSMTSPNYGKRKDINETVSYI